jgi:hypothetical protein
MSDIRVVIGKINVHGCLTVMQRRLETHVTIILIVFGVRVRLMQPEYSTMGNRKVDGTSPVVKRTVLIIQTVFKN